MAVFLFSGLPRESLVHTNPANCPRLRRNRHVSGDAEREAGLDEASYRTKSFRAVYRPATICARRG